MAAKEVKLQEKILKDLRSMGNKVVVFKIQKTSDNGVPDIFMTSMITGAMFIEVKKEGEKPSKLQTFMIDKLNSCGVQAWACDTWEKWVEIKRAVNLIHLQDYK